MTCLLKMGCQSQRWIFNGANAISIFANIVPIFENTMLEPRDLFLVREIARTGSIRLAADRLGVHQSTVFRRLAALEELLGLSLFDRREEGYLPTAAAEEVIKLALQMEEGLINLGRKLAGQDPRPSGVVRLTTTTTLMQGLLAPMLVKLRKQHPEITLEMRLSDQFLPLDRREADVALRPTNAPDGNLVGRHLADIGVAPYINREQLEGLNLRSPQHNLERLPWITFDDSLSHLPAAHWARRVLPDVTPVMMVNSISAALEATATGLGAAMLPCFLIHPRHDLVQISPPQPENVSQLWLLTHSDLRRVPRIRTVLDFLAGEIAKHRNRLAGGQDLSV